MNKLVQLEVYQGVCSIIACPYDVKVLIIDKDCGVEIEDNHDSELIVEVVVSGGVAEVTSCPPEVEVEIEELD